MRRYLLARIYRLHALIVSISVWLLFKVMQCYNYLVRKKYFIKQSHLYFIMSKQLIKLLLVKFELPSKLLHRITMNSNKH
jgi:hypothetical protein